MSRETRIAARVRRSGGFGELFLWPPREFDVCLLGGLLYGFARCFGRELESFDRVCPTDLLPHGQAGERLLQVLGTFDLVLGPLDFLLGLEPVSPVEQHEHPVAPLLLPAIKLDTLEAGLLFPLLIRRTDVM